VSTDPNSRIRVLIIDDNADTTWVMSQLLEAAGLETRAATSGPVALEIFHQWHPHAVLLDLGMPGMDGFQVCRQMRQTPDASSVLIVVISGYVQDEDRVRAIEAGANFYFTKPADPAKLLTLIRESSAADDSAAGD